jgi:putative ABC transport system permease protein
MGAAIALLCLACANVSNLLFFRFLAKGHDTAIRMALGATRWNVRRLFLWDALLLGGLGAIAGLVAARAMLLPLGGARLRADFPDISHVSLNTSVLLLCG